MPRYARDLRPQCGRAGGGTGGECRGRAVGHGPAGAIAWAALMGRRSPQSVLKRAREQALREKRELKQAKKDARAAERRNADDPPVDAAQTDAAADAQ